jgi:hypothetical protein
MNILIFPCSEKTSIGVGQSTSHKQERIGAGEEDVISNYRFWAEVAKDEERICEEKSVTELITLYYSRRASYDRLLNPNQCTKNGRVLY